MDLIINLINSNLEQMQETIYQLDTQSNQINQCFICMGPSDGTMGDTNECCFSCALDSLTKSHEFSSVDEHKK